MRDLLVAVPPGDAGVVVGRNIVSTLTGQNDWPTSCSGNHLKVTCTPKGVFVADANSTNGVWVARAAEPLPPVSGDDLTDAPPPVQYGITRSGESLAKLIRQGEPDLILCGAKPQGAVALVPGLFVLLCPAIKRLDAQPGPTHVGVVLDPQYDADDPHVLMFECTLRTATN